MRLRNIQQLESGSSFNGVSGHITSIKDYIKKEYVFQGNHDNMSRNK